MDNSTTIGIIGSGAMGSGISQVAAAAGHTVVLYDNSVEQLGKAKNNLRTLLDKLSEKGKLSKADADAIFNRIIFSENLSSFEKCGLVIEAIVENLEVKQKVFSELENLVS